MQNELKGLIVPVLTPFDESGAIDRPAFIRHLEFLEQSGVCRIMVNGTTAEFWALLPEERLELLKLARRHFAGIVILHAGGGSLAQNIVEVGWAAEFGADAAAVLPPSYPAELSAAGIIGYFQALEAVAEVPFILYNFPKHTGNPISPEILAAVPHVALKDSAQNRELMEWTPKYFIGTSTNIFTPIQQGAVGFVSATANVRPGLYAAFETLLVSARPEDAAVMQQEVQAYSRPFSAGGIPLLKKTLADKLHGYPAHVRLPLTG